MFKNWFLLASVSCGVGFGSTFLISRNLQQSALAGLGTVPAVAASLTILSRQRRKEIEHQVAKSRLGLDSLREQEKLTRKEIDRQVSESRLSLDDARQQEQLLKDNCRKISAHGQKLQTGCTQLRQEVDRLDAKVLDRQNNLQTTQAQLAQIQAQIQLESAAIHQYSANKQQLKAKIADLKNQDQSLKTILVDKKVDLRGIEYQISQMEDRRNQISIQISDLDLQKQSLQQAISALSLQKQDLEVLFNGLVLDISTKQNNLFKLDAEISKKQVSLDKITTDLVQAEARNKSAIYSAQISELALSNIQDKICQDSAIKEQLKVEIIDLQNKERNLKAEIDSYKVTLTEAQQQISVLKEQQDALSVQISQLEEERNRLSIAVDDSIQSAEGSENLEKWENNLIFKNNPHLRVLKHIDVYGTITELEVGTPREQRQFNIRFCEYLEYLPFSISNREGRYLKIAKESIIITNLQNPDDRAQIKQEIDKLNQQKEQLSIAIDELSRSVERDLERQVELRRNITDLLEEKQKLEDKVRIEQDRLNQIRNEIEDIGLDSVGEADESPPNPDNSDSYRRCSCGGTPVRGEFFCYRCT